MAVPRFNSVQVEMRLETLLLTGMVFLGWDEISLWWNFKRIDKKPWRDIHQLWIEMWSRQPFADTEDAPQLTLRGTTKALGGVRIFRSYVEEIDGKEVVLYPDGLGPSRKSG